MSQTLIFSIFDNFSSDYKEFKKSNTGRIKQYFDQAGVSKAKSFKMKTKGQRAIGKKTKNMLHGKAVVEYGDKNYYIGDYKNNHKNGQGYHRFINGLVYVGRYEDDKKVDGIVIDPKTSKVVYEGDWNYDTYHGEGKLSRRNGQYYKGTFDNGKFHGKGMIYWPNGDIYEGDFKKGAREGYGKFIYGNGDRYEGEFRNNVYEGNGVYNWNEGDQFKGIFKNGKMTGEGEMKYSIGILGSGVWDNMKGIDYSLTNLPPSMQDLPRN